MSAVSYNMRIDKQLRDEAFLVLDSYGLTPSQAFKLFLKQIATTKKVPLSFDYQDDYTLSAKGEKLLNQSIQEFENGEYETFESAEDFMKMVSKQAKKRA